MYVWKELRKAPPAPLPPPPTPMYLRFVWDIFKCGKLGRKLKKILSDECLEVPPSSCGISPCW